MIKTVDKTKNIPPSKKKKPRKIKKVAVKEIGGPQGPEPTRYGDWEVKGKKLLLLAKIAE